MPPETDPLPIGRLQVGDAFYNARFQQMLQGHVQNDPNYYATGVTQTEVHDQAMGVTINLLYVGIYLGIVFLIACGAVLGLRLLSDASDEKTSYKILRRVGATKPMLNHSVLSQVLAYFGLPLILAIPNAAIVGIVFAKGLSSTGHELSIMPAIVTALVLVLLYGGYFLITLLGYKKITNK